MERVKQAWIYCAIDAPEDTHGVLKGQFRQLCDYAEQMTVETAGSSHFVWMQSEPGMGRISAENAEEQEFFSMLSDFILQQRQKEVIRQKRF